MTVFTKEEVEYLFENFKFTTGNDFEKQLHDRLDWMIERMDELERDISSKRRHNYDPINEEVRLIISPVSE